MEKLNTKELLQILYALRSVYDIKTAEKLFEQIIISTKSSDVSLKVVPLSLLTHPAPPQISEG